MSWITCSDCTAAIDSDFDPDCFVEVGNMRRHHQIVVLCEDCRYERELEEGQADYQAGLAESEHERGQETKEDKDERVGEE